MSKVYDVITSRIISQLEKGTVPWHKPWKGNAQFPRNLISGKTYRGVNVFTLASTHYDSPYWLSYKQAAARGGQVKKGQKGSPVVYWKRLKPQAKGEDDQDESETSTTWRKGFHLYYTVFNSEQCKDIVVPSIEKPVVQFTPIELCESVVTDFKSPPHIHLAHTHAFYRPATDMVGMPKPERFDAAENFYGTLFHELSHSTGHSSRLARKGFMECAEFASNDYSKEELIAEMGSAFLSGRCGIESKLLDNSANYIGSWLRNLKNDSKLVVQAASHAQRSTDHILGRKYEEENGENGNGGNGNGQDCEGAD